MTDEETQKYKEFLQSELDKMNEKKVVKKIKIE
jgi:hypothetical protein